MTALGLLRRRRALLNCAPISHDHLADRSMRAAVSRADGSDEFVNQQNFDRAVAELIRLVPLPPESAEWFLDKEAVRRPKWTWRRIILNPAVLAISIALVVIAGVFTFQVLGRLNDFPGSATARKLLTVAGSTRSVTLDPVSAEAGTLSDLFFMKHGLEHYDVPDEFADFRTIGCRVFDDDESQRIAQIWVAEKRMQFFRFPVGVMCIRKGGSVQLRNTTAFASWPPYKAERKTWSRIFLDQSSSSSFGSRSCVCSRLNIVDSRIKSTSRKKSRKRNARFAFALTAQIMRLSFVAADFARVARCQSSPESIRGWSFKRIR